MHDNKRDFVFLIMQMKYLRHITKMRGQMVIILQQF